MTVSPTIRPLEECRFDALAGYTRQPLIVQIVQEFDWMATTDERVLGVLTWDRIDHDFGWVALGRDERLRFRAIQVNASLPSADEAKAQLVATMAEQSAKPDAAFHQGDAIGRLVDFFTAVVADDRLNRSFRILTGHERYSPARELIAAMMPFYEDVDRNFIEQSQTTAFDARLWELYLFAASNELGYARSTEVAVPDFLLTSALGRLGVEATTINAPNSGHTPMIESSEQIRAYLEGYIPIKLARTLKRKLNRRKPY